MTAESIQKTSAQPVQEVRTERVFDRFNVGQRWEHGALIISFTTLLLTGLPQKYFNAWGHYILTTPASVDFVRQIHRIAAILLILEIIYHVGRGLALLFRR